MLMSNLKLTLTPMFSTFHPKLGKNIITLKPISNTTLYSKSTPTVRRNSSTKTDSVFNLLKHPPTSAYVHLPFCRKRCHYCDFPIVALGSSLSTQTNAVDNDPRIENYIDLLTREIAATGGADPDTQLPLETVFFGGGTPSLVPPRLVAVILEALGSKFGLRSEGLEVSMEMDPGTFNAERLKGFTELGVNRVSLGVQAFQDKLLKSCGRAHGAKEVHEAVEIVRSCGVDNWSLDLISSLPNQTSEMWAESLGLAIEAGPTHLLVYDLQIEQGTKFGSLYKPGEFPLPSDSQSAEFYEMASNMLRKAGYNHYEISSYSKPGFDCKHNQVYWKNAPFYGFGLGSTSHVGGLRFSRPKKMKLYRDFVTNLENGTVNWNKNEGWNSLDVASDIVMLSLRTSRGLDLRAFREDFGGSSVKSLCDGFRAFVESGHVVFLDDKRNVLGSHEFSDQISYLRLSDPDGFLLSNEIISHAFQVLSQ